MPNIRDIARDGAIRDHIIASIVSQSAEDFIRNFPKTGHQHPDQEQLGAQTLALLRCAVITQYSPIPRSGSYLCQKALRQTRLLGTGLPRFDQLLAGGFMTCEMTEVYGSSCTGKTQLCHHLAAASSAECSVIYIDSNNTFSPQRIVEILQSQQQSDQVITKSLDGIKVIQCVDALLLQDCILQVISHKKVKADECFSNVQLLIVDNLATIFSPIIGYKQYEGVAIMRSIGMLMKRLAAEFHVAVVVVNGTVSGGTEFLPKAGLGVHWLNIPHNRILVQGYQSSSNTIRAKIITSIRLPVAN